MYVAVCMRVTGRTISGREMAMKYTPAVIPIEAPLRKDELMETATTNGVTEKFTMANGVVA